MPHQSRYRNIRNLAFNLKLSAFQKNAWRSLNELMQNQSLSADQLEALNWQRRVDLVNHCATSIPFYKRKFEQIGFRPGDLKTEADFRRLPILEKEDIRKFASQLVNPRYSLEELPASTTGGTTGMPLRTYNDPRIHLSSMSWRMLDWWGVSPSDNSGYLYRAIPTGFKKLLIAAALYPTRRLYLSAADMTPRAIETFYVRLRKSNPKYLVGYVGAIDAFARYLKQTALDLPSLECVWTTSAPLMPHQRLSYEEAFDCPVYTQYGSCEFYWIAAECRRQAGLHLGTDIRHVDVVEGTQSVRPGEFGDLLITDLSNYAFPLLRYRLGDRGRILTRRCNCELPFPLIDYVKGRISDAIRFPDGSTIPGEYWTTIFDDFPDQIKSFQVYQDKNFALEIRYEPNQGTAIYDALATVKQRLQSKLAGRIAVTFREQPLSINPDQKTKFVISDAGD